MDHSYSIFPFPYFLLVPNCLHTFLILFVLIPFNFFSTFPRIKAREKDTKKSRNSNLTSKLEAESAKKCGKGNKTKILFTPELPHRTQENLSNLMSSDFPRKVETGFSCWNQIEFVRILPIQLDG